MWVCWCARNIKVQNIFIGIFRSLVANIFLSFFFLLFLNKRSFQHDHVAENDVKHLEKRSSVDIQPVIMPFTSEDFTTKVCPCTFLSRDNCLDFCNVFTCQLLNLRGIWFDFDWCFFLHVQSRSARLFDSHFFSPKMSVIFFHQFLPSIFSVFFFSFFSCQRAFVSCTLGRHVGHF